MFDFIILFHQFLVRVESALRPVFYLSLLKQVGINSDAKSSSNESNNFSIFTWLDDVLK